MFSLPGLDGEMFSLSPGIPAVLLFFKASCPTCQYAMPFFERLYAKANRASFFGVSQDDPRKTREFVRSYGISFPVLIDNAPKYTVSNAYGLTNVPTPFLVSADGTVEFSSAGWARVDMD